MINCEAFAILFHVAKRRLNYSFWVEPFWIAASHILVSNCELERAHFLVYTLASASSKLVCCGVQRHVSAPSSNLRTLLRTKKLLLRTRSLRCERASERVFETMAVSGRFDASGNLFCFDAKQKDAFFFFRRVQQSNALLRKRTASKRARKHTLTALQRRRRRRRRPPFGVCDL